MIILASASRARHHLLSAAGIAHKIMASPVNENMLHQRYADLAPKDLALRLAIHKAETVAESRPNDVVIGCDQTMALDAKTLHKPQDFTAAKLRLRQLRGRTHILFSSYAIVRRGAVIAGGVDSAQLTMRNFSEDFLEAYLEQMGENVLQSVGCYQVEAKGLQLFSEIKGDYFTVLGLPLLPLLASLREMGEVAS
jgi:septum formation protein